MSYTASTRELYIGQFQNNERSGEGYLIHSEGTDSTGNMKFRQQYYSGMFKNGKPEGQGQVIKEQPNLVKIMDKCGMDLDMWNSFDSKIKISKDIIKTLQLKPNN